MEIEIKARVKSPSDIRRKILEMGARFLGVERQEDSLLDSPLRDFRQTDEVLRIRRIENRCSVLTYKGARDVSKVKRRAEFNVQVSNGKTLRKILKLAGFKESLIIRKRRQKYLLGKIVISLDNVENLGTFIEIEGEAEEDDAEEQILSFLEKLGISRNDIEAKTYPELIREYTRTKRSKSFVR